MSFPWCVVVGPQNIGESTPRGIALQAVLWPPDSAIPIAFLDGDSALQSRVEAAARRWLSCTSARLSFEFRAAAVPGSIRISFRREGSWSRLGTTVWDVESLTEPTMNFGTLTAASSDVEVREVVLHEFGHALGLLHEHQHPEAHIPWKRDAVIAALTTPPNAWTAKMVDDNVFKGHSRGDLKIHPFDARSIMLYPIDPTWTTDGSSTTNNTDLSDGDIALVNEIYG